MNSDIKDHSGQRDCPHGRQLGKCADCEAEHLKKVIADPEAVFVNMKRGAIAKPSLRSIVELYAGEVLNGEDVLQAEILRLREVNSIQLEVAEVHGAACAEIRNERDALRAELAEVKGRKPDCFVVGKSDKIAVIDSPLPVSTKLYASPPASPDVEGQVNELQRIAEKCSDPDTTDALDTAISTWRQAQESDPCKK